jgi:hypothetical protein
VPHPANTNEEHSAMGQQENLATVKEIYDAVGTGDGAQALYVSVEW